MNIKTIINRHSHMVKSPIAYLGITEGEDHKNSIVFEGKNMSRVAVMDLLADLNIFVWAMLNDSLASAGLPKVNRADFLSAMYHHMSQRPSTDLNYE